MRAKDDEIKWPSGPSISKFYKDIFKNRNSILNGSFTVIDPSSAGDSCPGFAVYHAGQLQCRGDIQVNRKLKVNVRLQQIYDKLIEIAPPPDLLIVEKLRGVMAPAELMFSVGTAMSAIRAPVAIEMPIPVWRAYAGTEYTDKKKKKLTLDSDDAVMMGEAVLFLAMWGKE
jgi:hypothetical protein